ncbi:peptidoglycan DD-metalloendopeptidase family protein [Candidatus Saccharibacteria bacterium]|nr:peptidoglycan DD-metalloendopeptidase family protein [Candidatus Saccharibacteria bacterium]
MPQTGYDRDADERRAPAAGGERFEDQIAGDFSRHDVTGMEQRSSEGAAVDQQGLRRREENSRSQTAGEESGRGVQSEAIRDAPSSADNERGGLFNTQGKDGRGESRREKFKGSAHKLAGNKFFIGGALAGVGGLGTLIVLALLLVATLSIPNLAANITGYQFAKVSRQYARNAQRITNQSLATKGLNDGAYEALKERVKGTRAGQAFKKLDDMRPEKIAANLKTDGKISYQFESPSVLNVRQKLQSVTLNGHVYNKQNLGGTRFIPGLSSILEANNQYNFGKSFGPALSVSLRATEAGTISRTGAANLIRKNLGLKMIAFELGKYIGSKDEKAIARAQFREEATRVNANLAPGNAVTPDIVNAVADAEAAATAALTDDKAVDTAIAKKGIFASVQESIAKSFEKSLFASITTGLLKIANPVFAVAGPLCIIYDGSLDKSQGTIDNDSKQKMAAFTYITAAADQQKYGGSSTALTSAIGALNTSVGDYSHSVPQRRAGSGIDDTSFAASTQSSAGGQYSLLDALGFPPGFGAVADEVCPQLNDIGVNAGIIGANLFANFFSAGGVKITEDAAAKIAQAIAEKEGANLVQRFLIRATIYGGRGKEFVFGQAKSAAGIAGLTLMAKYIVANRAGQMSNGTAMGDDAVNAADAGGNLMGNEISRSGSYGRPLTSTETLNGNKEDVRYVLKQNASKSAYERYLSPSNTNSLVAKMAFSISGGMHGPASDIITKMGLAIFSPTKLASSLFGSFSSHASAAATETNYNNVQFAWPEEEEKLIDSDSKYSPILNAEYLDQHASQVEEIQSTYDKCFTESMGTLLSSGDLKRDENGTVLSDDSTCSPKTLSINNPKYNDLVFRWRLDKRYNSGSDDLLSIQDPTPAASTTSAQPSTSTPPAGGSINTTGAYVLPVDQKWYAQHPNWFTDPHHDTPAVDIPVPMGTPVYSMNAGIILRAPNGGGYGEGVMIQGDDGFQYIYGHGTDGGSLPGITPGKHVTPGQLIMHAGNTGDSFGAHLHLNIQTSFDPKDFYCPQNLLVAIATKAPLPAVGSLPQKGCTY